MTDPAADPSPTDTSTGDTDSAADPESFADRLQSAMDAHESGDAPDADAATNATGPDSGAGADGADGALGADGADGDLFDPAAALAPDAPQDDALTTALAERDGYLDALQRLKAEFDNHKRRTGEQAVQQREQAAATLVEKLLPVLDACEAALVHDAEAVRPVADQLLEALGAQGLTVLAPTGELFDPEEHEAVMHEPGDGSGDPIVEEVMRTGYAWNGRVVRPAMVKVKG